MYCSDMKNTLNVCLYVCNKIFVELWFINSRGCLLEHKLNVIFHNSLYFNIRFVIKLKFFNLVLYFYHAESTATVASYRAAQNLHSDLTFNSTFAEFEFHDISVFFK
jgi:hypothetical protein